MRGLAITLGPVLIVSSRDNHEGWSILLRVGSREWEVGALTHRGARR